MRHAALAVVLLAAGMAGCIGDVPSDEQLKGAAVAETGSLAAPPALEVGNWWTFEATWAFGGSSYDGTIVVTERTEEAVHLGVSADTRLHEVMELHLPPVGISTLDTLAWNVHGSDFEPVRFPLEPGRSWTTEWGPAGEEVEVNVVEVDGAVAELEAVGQNSLLEYVYDGEIGMIAGFEAPEGSFDITAHGTDYEGEVETPTDVDMDVFGGRLAGVVDLAAFPVPGPPVETAELERDVSHVSVGLFAGNFPVEGPAGVYRAAATAPDGTTFELTFAQDPTGPGSVFEVAGHDTVQGTWEMEYVAGGAGVAAVEIVGYDLHETKLVGDSEPVGGRNR